MQRWLVGKWDAAESGNEERSAAAHLPDELPVFRFVADEKASLQRRKKRGNRYEENGSQGGPARRHSQTQPLDLTAFRPGTECCLMLARAVLESSNEWTFRRRTKDVGSYRGHSADSQQRR